MSNKYVKVDDVMNLINTTNRGNCDYFIVDDIEIKKYKEQLKEGAGNEV